MKKLPTGKGFKEDVELNGRDIDSLLSETDPYALELAQKKTRELDKRIKGVQENPKVYSQNKDRLGKLSQRISKLQEKCRKRTVD